MASAVESAAMARVPLAGTSWIPRTPVGRPGEEEFVSAETQVGLPTTTETLPQGVEFVAVQWVDVRRASKATGATRGLGRPPVEQAGDGAGSRPVRTMVSSGRNIRLLSQSLMLRRSLPSTSTRHRCRVLRQ